MVIDTMVFAYALLGVEPHKGIAIKSLEKADAIIVPDSIRAELGNVTLQWIRQRGVAFETGISVMEDAEALYTRVLSAEVLWESALALATDAGHPFYDTLFIAAADLENTHFITFDQRLLNAFPNDTIAPSQFI
jgi:predicted nucleic acid-binding protein